MNKILIKIFKKQNKIIKINKSIGKLKRNQKWSTWGTKQKKRLKPKQLTIWYILVQSYKYYIKYELYKHTN